MDLVEVDFSFSRERHHVSILLMDVGQFDAYPFIGLFMAWGQQVCNLLKEWLLISQHIEPILMVATL